MWIYSVLNNITEPCVMKMRKPANIIKFFDLNYFFIIEFPTKDQESGISYEIHIVVFYLFIYLSNLEFSWKLEMTQD